MLLTNTIPDCISDLFVLWPPIDVNGSLCGVECTFWIICCYICVIWRSDKNLGVSYIHQNSTKLPYQYQSGKFLFLRYSPLFHFRVSDALSNIFCLTSVSETMPDGKAKRRALSQDRMHSQKNFVLRLTGTISYFFNDTLLLTLQQYGIDWQYYIVWW